MRYAIRRDTATEVDPWERIVPVLESPCPYTRLTNDRCRWGDYSVVWVDPDDGSFWAANELATPAGPFEEGKWTTFWVNFDFYP